MKRLFHLWLGLGIRRRPQLRASLVTYWQDNDEVLRTTLRANLKAAGMQALLQVLEMEAAAETELALSHPVSEYHAGSAAALLRVLGEVAKTQVVPTPEKSE